jgi:membrane AbrB-like protein
MAPLRPSAQWALLLALSLALAALLALAAFPAALLLGPLLAGIAMALRGATVRVPRACFLVAQALIGCLVAHAMTGSILLTLAADRPLMPLTVATTIVTGGSVGRALTRLEVLPGTTAAWGSSPGAASAMVAMAEEFGADPRLVALMQYLRVVMVALSASLVSRLLVGGTHGGGAPTAPEPLMPPPLPLLATLAVGVIGRRLRIPAGPLLAPMAVGGALHATGLVAMTLPPWLMAAAYVALGWHVGLRFDRETTRRALRAIPRPILASLALIALTTILLMTAPAYHRIVEQGEDTERFHRVSGRLLLASMPPLALGVAGDVYVVATKILRSDAAALAAAAATVVLFLALWFGWTLVDRARGVGREATSSRPEEPEHRLAA